MKLFKTFTFCMTVVAFLFVGISFQGCQEKATDGTIEVNGTVQQNGDEFIVASEGKQYILKGQDFSSMKGHMAIIKGKVTTEGEKEIITASSAKVEK
ncbi:MAG: hypothetical protein WAM61_20660 [Desulfobacterales bacterium]